MTATTTTIEIKPYSIKELSGIYGVCDKTFKKWLLPFADCVGKKQGRYYTVAQVVTIFDKLGIPTVFCEA